MGGETSRINTQGYQTGIGNGFNKTSGNMILIPFQRLNDGKMY